MADFEEETSLGIMEDCYNNLKAESELCPWNPLRTTYRWPDADYKCEQLEDTAPPVVDDEILDLSPNLNFNIAAAATHSSRI